MSWTKKMEWEADSWDEVWWEEKEQGSEMKTVTERKGQTNVGKTVSEMYGESSICPGNQRYRPWSPLVLSPGVLVWLHLIGHLHWTEYLAVWWYSWPCWFTKPQSWHKRASCYFQGISQWKSLWQEMECYRKDMGKKNNWGRQKRKERYVQ